MPSTDSPMSSPITILPGDLTKPSITPISIVTSLFTSEHLDKNKSNWQDWSRDVIECLGMSQGLDGHLDGTFECPDVSIEPRAYRNWKINDKAVRLFLSNKSVKAEHEFINATTTAKDAWNALKARHEVQGPIQQVLLIQEALDLRYSRAGELLSVTSSKFADLNERIWNMGTPSKDLFLCILMINGLSGDLADVRSALARELAKASSDTPYSPADIRRALDVEQQLISGDKKGRDIILTTQANPRQTTSRFSSSISCSNCKKPGHTAPYCISEGGGMAGKSLDDSRAARRRDREAKASKPANLSVIKDANGKAYIVNLDTNTILDGQPTLAPNAESTNFVGLSSAASRTIPPISDEEAIEYDGWMTVEDLTTTVDWKTHRREVDLTAVTINSPKSKELDHPQLEDSLFFLDTGATVHISPDSADFSSLRPISSRSVKGVGGSSISAIGIGNIRLCIAKGANIILHDVLYIPQATVRLISVSRLAVESHVVSHFDNQTCWLTKKSTNTTIAHGTLTSRSLYALNLITPQTEHTLITTAHPTIETWHRRLGHANYQAISDMFRKNMTSGMSFDSSTVPSKCQSCVSGKQTRTPVPKARQEGRRATKRLEIVWADLSGPHAVTSRSGNNYVLNLVDDATNYPWSIPIPSKDTAYSELKDWELARERETGAKVGTYRTDNGELKSNAMEAWLRSRGTQHEFTAPYTSAHIGRVERMHRTLMNKARTMRIYADLPPSLWDELYLTASYLHTLTTTRSLNDSTPFAKWYKKKPNLSHLREIGCKAFVLIQNKNNPKIYERSVECTLVGYEPRAKAYRCYHRPTQKIITSYHVSFIESHQTGPPLNLPPQHPEPPVTLQHNHPTPHNDLVLPDLTDTDDDPIMTSDPVPDNEPDAANPETANPVPPPPRRSSRTRNPTEKGSTAESTHQSRIAAAVADARLSATRIKEERAARLQRIQELRAQGPPIDQPSADSDAIDQLRDFIDNPTGSLNDDATKKLDEIFAAISDEVPNFVFEDEPRTWDEAKKSPDGARWEAGYREELQSLKDMGVYELVPRDSVPVGTKVRKGRPIFRLKRDEHGVAVRWKVRVVFKGFEQIYGRDFTKTTSPTARMESWRILLHIAASLGWDTQQIDVKTAFLYGLLPDDEVQYMEQPQDFPEPGKEAWVWKLQRGLYGMKQAGRIWNKTMNDAMISWGFARLGSESCIYYRARPSGTVIATVHVDDFLSIASSKEENESFKNDMKTKWKISDLGDVSFCVGIAIRCDRATHSVSLSQTALIDRIVLQFGQKDSHPISTPMDPGLKLQRTNKSLLSTSDTLELERIPYRSLVGSLIYIAVGTRPDITYAVQQLSQYLDSYSFSHWNAAVRVVRYLKGTRDLRLTLGGNNRLKLLGYTDSDWANCLDTRRSIGGYCYTLGSGLISWNARKQKTVAASSCEAEYVAAFEAAKEAIWLRSLLLGIDFPQAEATAINCDNNSAINLSEDPSLHSRVKHVDIKFHFLRERVQSNELLLSYINTKDNIADAFTKALPAPAFRRLRWFMGLKPTSASA